MTNDKTIDVRMTWQGIAPLIATGISAGGAAHSAALQELYTMARMADTLPTLLDALQAVVRCSAIQDGDEVLDTVLAALDVVAAASNRGN